VAEEVGVIELRRQQHAVSLCSTNERREGVCRQKLPEIQDEFWREAVQKHPE
jgi:hypothetical protein